MDKILEVEEIPSLHPYQMYTFQFEPIELYFSLKLAGNSKAFDPTRPGPVIKQIYMGLSRGEK